MECEAEVMVKKYRVHLTGEEQGELKGLVLSPNPPKVWHTGSCRKDQWDGRADDSTHWPTDRANGCPEWSWVIQTVGRQSAEYPR